MNNSKQLKVGIVTLYAGASGYINTNYGATLQAYALQEKLRQWGMESDVIYIDFTSNNIMEQLKRNIHQGTLLKKLKDKVFLKVKYKKDTMKDGIFAEKEKSKLESRQLAVQKFARTYIKTSTMVHRNNLESIGGNYDFFIAGSDQIWNPVCWESAYFLAFVPDEICKIAYAASIGVTHYTYRQKKFVKKGLNRFDFLSVREESAVHLIAPLTKKEVRVVLDPTLLLSTQDWEKISRDPKLEIPYLFCYLLGENKEHNNYVRELADKIGLCLVVLAGETKTIENNLEFGDIHLYHVDSAELLGLIRDAKVVITDSFHVMAFSINYRKVFYVLKRNSDSSKNSMNSRIYDLLHMLQLEQQLVTPDKKYLIELEEERLYKGTGEVLERWIKESENWLKKALGIS